VHSGADVCRAISSAPYLIGRDTCLGKPYLATITSARSTGWRENPSAILSNF